jgi:hypothetical protein
LPCGVRLFLGHGLQSGGWPLDTSSCPLRSRLMQPYLSRGTRWRAAVGVASPAQVAPMPERVIVSTLQPSATASCFWVITVSGGYPTGGRSRGGGSVGMVGCPFCPGNWPTRAQWGVRAPLACRCLSLTGGRK